MSTSTPPQDHDKTVRAVDAFGNLAAALAERTGPAVVSLGRDHRGSGVVIAANTLLTNAHNLADRTIQVTFADGRVAQASVRGADPAGDLVVLDVDTAAIEPVELAPAAPGVGTPVFALAGSASGPRISFGIVSSTGRAFRGPGGRPIAGSVEHTAPLPRGASGGPLLDAHGRLIAVNTHRPSAGLYLARPLDEALLGRLGRLQAGETLRPTRLGVALAPSAVAQRMRAAVGLEPRDGLLVRGVVADSPAARSDVRAGDLLVRAGDADLREVADLFNVLGAHDSANPLELAIVRGTEELTVAVAFTGDAPTELAE